MRYTCGIFNVYGKLAFRGEINVRLLNLLRKSTLCSGCGLLRLVADIIALSGASTRGKSAGQQTIVLIEVVVRVLYLFFAAGLRIGGFILVAEGEKVVALGHVSLGRDAHDDQIEDSDHAYEDGEGCVDGVLGVEKEK